MTCLVSKATISAMDENKLPLDPADIIALEEEIAGYNEEIEQLGNDPELSARYHVAEVMYNKGAAFVKMGRLQEAASVYYELLERLNNNWEKPLKEMVTRSWKAIISIYQENILQFEKNEDPASRLQVAGAMMNVAWALGRINKPREASAIYEDIIERFGNDREPPMREVVAQSLLNQGGLVSALSNVEEGLVVYDEVIARFGKDPEPLIQVWVAQAMFNKALAEGGMGRHDEEITIYNELITHYGPDSELAILELVAESLLNKAGILMEMGKPEEEAAVYNEIIKRFGKSGEPSLQERVERAMELRNAQQPTENI